MSDALRNTISALVFPGLLWALALSALLALVIGQRLSLGGLARGLRAALTGRAPLLLLPALLLPLLALPLLPWPFARQPLGTLSRNMLIFWAALEASAALALLPGLRSPSPYAIRGAIREAQIGGAGRVVVWAVAGTLLWAGPWTSPFLIPGLLLLLGALLLAVPAALGWGAFAPESGVAPGGAEAGLDSAALELAQWARAARAAAMLSLAVLSPLPGLSTLPEPVRAAVALAALLVLALSLRAIGGRSVRRTLPDALRFCWSRALPLALLGLVAVLLARRTLL